MRLRGTLELSLLTMFAILLSGCAVLIPNTSCEQFAIERKSANYDTEYKRDDRLSVEPLRRGTAIATEYRLWLERERVEPCSHVIIRKELTLLRHDQSGTLEETREFFAEDGTRIAVKQENLTAQLRHSGRYSAAVPLPIPKTAPAGAYYLVSTLTLKTRGDYQVLAKTAAHFTVAAERRIAAPRKR